MDLRWRRFIMAYWAQRQGGYFPDDATTTGPATTTPPQTSTAPQTTTSPQTTTPEATTTAPQTTTPEATTTNAIQLDKWYCLLYYAFSGQDCSGQPAVIYTGCQQGKFIQLNTCFYNGSPYMAVAILSGPYDTEEECLGVCVTTTVPATTTAPETTTAEATTTAPETTTFEATTTHAFGTCGLFVSGAGTGNANQLYCQPTEDLYNGENYYQGITRSNWQIRYGDTPGKWAIMELGSPKYEADDILGPWTAVEGANPAPTVIWQCSCPPPIPTTTEPETTTAPETTTPPQTTTAEATTTAPLTTTVPATTTAAAAGPDYVGSGAGNPAANGDFYYAGTYNGFDYFHKTDDGNGEAFLFVAVTNRWCVYSSLNMSNGMWYGAPNTSAGVTPDLGEYTVGGGDDPHVTIAEG